MARQVRIEFEGAFYHVVARGDRKEPIVADDTDRQTFVRTLGQACARAGFRVHAWVLMTNHYHLLLETPEPNLSRGMGWLQNAFTRRINTRHGWWGHVFGDRYKAILVEPGNYFWELMDYIHLNPSRAGLVGPGQGLESYRWSSLPDYIGTVGRRPKWLETQTGFEVAGCRDTAGGRRKFLELLDERMPSEKPTATASRGRIGQEGAVLARGVALRRGWFFGSQEFGERLAKLASGKLSARSAKRCDGYVGADVNQHGVDRAERILKAGCKVLGTAESELRQAACNDSRKVFLAGVLQSETTVKLDWIRERLAMGDRSYCCRLIRRGREVKSGGRKLESMRKRILEMSINHD